MWPTLHMLYSSSSRGSAALLARADSIHPTIAGCCRNLMSLTCGSGAACTPELQQQVRRLSSQGSHHDTPSAKLLQDCVHNDRLVAVRHPGDTSSENCTSNAQAAGSKHTPSHTRQKRLQQLPLHLCQQESHCMPSVQGSTLAYRQVCTAASRKSFLWQLSAQLQAQQQQRWQTVSHHHRWRSKAHLSWSHCTYTPHSHWQHRHHAPQYQQQHHWQHQQQQHYHQRHHQGHKAVASKHQGSTVAASAGSLHQEVQGTASPQGTQQTSRHPEQQADAVAGSTLTTLPNLLSLSRVATSPLLAYCIASHYWPMAIGLTAAAGASDWLDGYVARRLKHTSKLGSYLDPLADKVFIASAVGTMGYMGMLPTWLAVAVVGRDSVQVVGMFWYRLRMFGGVWPGASAFFNVDGDLAPLQPPDASHSSNSSSGSGSSRSSSSSSSMADISSSNIADGSTSHSVVAVGTGPDTMQHGVADTAAAAHQQVVAGGLPMIRPLLISKVNTALVMALVAGCMGQQWQGVPDAGILHSLELVAASTTLASAAAYAHLHWSGRLLADPPNKTDGAQ